MCTYNGRLFLADIDIGSMLGIAQAQAESIIPDKKLDGDRQKYTVNQCSSLFGSWQANPMFQPFLQKIHKPPDLG